MCTQTVKMGGKSRSKNVPGRVNDSLSHALPCWRPSSSLHGASLVGWCAAPPPPPDPMGNFREELGLFLIISNHFWSFLVDCVSGGLDSTSMGGGAV